MLKNALAVSAAAAFFFTPVAAQAGERASQTTVSLAPLVDASSREAAPASEESEEIGTLTRAEIAAIALALGFVIHEILTSKGIIH